MGVWWRWALVSPDGVALSWMVCVSASVNLPLHHKVQKFSSGTGSPGWSRKKGHKTVVVQLPVYRFSKDCYILVVLFHLFPIHQFFNVPGPMFVKLCHIMQYVPK